MTTVHEELDDAAREAAALHALSALPAAKAAAMEHHLTTCAPCRAEVERAAATLASLAELSPTATPPAALKARLMERIHAAQAATDAAALAVAVSPAGVQTWKTWPTDGVEADKIILAASDTEWEDTTVPGIRARRLFVDTAGDRVTMLVRMDPGTSYPPHVHGGAEECFVLEGDLDVGGIRMLAGSYQRVAAGSRHPWQSTINGCLLLLNSSLHDTLDLATA